MDLLDGLAGGTLVHPFCPVKLFHKLSLDVRDNSVPKVFGISGKGLFNKKPAKNPP